MKNLTAKDIMTNDVKTISDQTTLGEVARFLTTNDISGVPVVDDSGALVGIISEADLMDHGKRTAVIPRMALYGLWIIPDELIEESYKEGFALKACDVMSRKVITASQDAPVQELADLMLKKRINRIPIVEDGKLVGIVTRHDILRGLISE